MYPHLLCPPVLPSQGGGLGAGAVTFRALHDQRHDDQGEPQPAAWEWAQFDCGLCMHTHTHSHTHTHTHTQLHLSNAATPGLPGLEDVGVAPTALEDKALTVLRRFRDFLDFNRPVDELEAPTRS